MVLCDFLKIYYKNIDLPFHPTSVNDVLFIHNWIFFFKTLIKKKKKKNLFHVLFLFSFCKFLKSTFYIKVTVVDWDVLHLNAMAVLREGIEKLLLDIFEY